jgi:predicted dehydrogenase
VVDAVRSAAQSACARVAPGAGTAVRAADFSELPGEIDVAIIATTAATRLEALENLLRSTKVAHVVLEKILFQRDSDFQRAGELLAESGATAWVNCGRRQYPIYQKIRETLARSDAPVLISVAGSNLRLGTNLVHFVDLFTYLTGQREFTLDATGLDAQPLASKRAGNLEFNGLVRMRSARGDAAEILSLDRPVLARHVVIRSGAISWIIDETTGDVAVQMADGFRAEKVDIPLQSEMSNQFIEDLVVRSTCALTPYAESVSLHRRMFEGLDAALESRWPQWLAEGVRPVT